MFITMEIDGIITRTGNNRLDRPFTIIVDWITLDCYSIYYDGEGEILIMIKITFTEEEIKQLHHERFHHFHPQY